MVRGKRQFVNGEIYHIAIRGVGDSLVFQDDDDYYRGIFSLYEFNTSKPIDIRIQRQKRKQVKASGGQTVDERDYLVDILAFCFMPNHLHLLLRQIQERGVPKFMQKVGTGYATYFNKKYNRKGHLFGRFHAVYIRDEPQLKTVFVYIHCNPLSLIEPRWKEKRLGNSQRAIDFLENYKWASYADYLGRNNFPSVTARDFLLKIMGSEEGCRNFLEGWVKYKKDLKDWHKIAIE